MQKQLASIQSFIAEEQKLRAEVAKNWARYGAPGTVGVPAVQWDAKSAAGRRNTWKDRYASGQASKPEKKSEAMSSGEMKQLILNAPKTATR